MNKSSYNFLQKIGKGEIWAFSSAIAYSLDNLFAAVAVRGQGINFIFGAVLRSIPVLIFSLFVVLFSRSKGRDRFIFFKDKKILLALSCYGILTFFLGNIMFFSAMQKGGVLVTTPLAGTQVLLAALFAVIILGEALTMKMAAGMLVSILGILILTLGKSSGLTLVDNWWLSIPLGIGAAACWSLSGVLIAYVQRKGCDRFQALLFALVVGNLVLNLYLIMTGQSYVYLTTPPHLIGKVLTAGLFNILALVGMTTALGLTSVASAATVNSLQICIAPLLAWAAIGEKINFLIGIGILLILTGVMIVQVNRLKYIEENQKV